jgi:enoyl-CoA hydratase/carnithine racemase
MPSPTPDAASNLLVRVFNGVLIVTLDRPAALNALSLDMVRELALLLERARTDSRIAAVVLRGAGGKAFCAGGDVRMFYEVATNKSMQPEDAARQGGWLPFFIHEYRLDYAIHTFPKPIVALMDGITMGGGMGLAQGAALRVVTERSKIAMPETRIGMLPDVGATHFLARMPVELELYLGLTGVTLTGADALVAGLADLCVPASSLDGWEARLENGWNSSPPVLDLLAGHWNSVSSPSLTALRDVFTPPGNVTPPSALTGQLPWITRHFGERQSVPQIVETLRADLAQDALPPEQRHWLQTTLDALTSHSPTMLAVTREALLRGRNMTLADSFRMEIGIVSRTIGEGDFCEGVRAHLIDKDHQPRWLPATLAEVDDARVRHYLTPPWEPHEHPLRTLVGETL